MWNTDAPTSVKHQRGLSDRVYMTLSYRRRGSPKYQYQYCRETCETLPGTSLRIHARRGGGAGRVQMCGCVGRLQVPERTLHTPDTMRGKLHRP